MTPVAQAQPQAQPASKITVHWHVLPYILAHNISNMPFRLESSRVQRLLVLLEELNLQYSIKTYKRNKDALAPESLKNIHPLGKSPSVGIELPGQTPFVLAESGAIFEYLCAHFGKQLIPARGASGEIGVESEEFRRNRYFMHYAEGSLMSLLAIAAVMLSMLYRKQKSRFRQALYLKPHLPTPSRHQKRTRPLFHQTNHSPDHQQDRRDVPRPQLQDTLRVLGRPAQDIAAWRSLSLREGGHGG